MARCIHVRTATAVEGWCAISNQMSGSESTTVTATARRKGRAWGPTTSARRPPRRRMPSQPRPPSGGRSPKSENGRSPSSRGTQLCRARPIARRRRAKRPGPGPMPRAPAPALAATSSRYARLSLPPRTLCPRGGSLCLAVHGTARHRMIVPGSISGATSPLRHSAAPDRRVQPRRRALHTGVTDPTPSDPERSARRPRAGPTNSSRK